ncbi:hypothetical protein ACF3NR_05265 [Vaginella massiliensis]|jgi:hypothetical protein|uniref:hypothetical protein n=1 Tax=Flavobacteriales TaxID=200644 RepID=UPI0008380868|nr:MULTISPECIES: hypothetical protein [Flavobacteriales]MDK7674507.1 hypothetical protein [Weeksella virosa]
MRKILLAGAFALFGTYAMANEVELKNNNSEITSLIDDCFYYEYEEESLTIWSDGSWEYSYYFESGIVCF